MSWLKKRAEEAAKDLVDGWDRGSSSRTEIAELVEAVAREFAERVLKHGAQDDLYLYGTVKSYVEAADKDET